MDYSKIENGDLVVLNVDGSKHDFIANVSEEFGMPVITLNAIKKNPAIKIVEVSIFKNPVTIN